MNLQAIEKVKRYQMMAASNVVQMRQEIAAVAERYPEDADVLSKAADAAYEALASIHEHLQQAAVVAYERERPLTSF